jgi:hypothetical protein
MVVSQEEREEFLNRLGAVKQVRRRSGGKGNAMVSEDEKEWTDEEIQMAIDMGF